MKRKTLQIVVAFLLGLSLLLVWRAEANISRASGDSNLTLSPVKTMATTSLQVRGERLTQIQQSSATQLEVKQQSFSDPQNPGHAPGHPRQSALIPLLFSVLGAILLIALMVVTAVVFSKKRPTLNR